MTTIPPTIPPTQPELSPGVVGIYDTPLTYDECIDGFIFAGFPMDSALEWCAEKLPTTTAEVAVGQPPVPTAAQTLPVTGGAEIVMALAACAAVTLGGLAALVARR